MATVLDPDSIAVCPRLGLFASGRVPWSSHWDSFLKARPEKEARVDDLG